MSGRLKPAMALQLKKTRKAVKAETRSKILKAGAKIIWEEGFASFTMNKISKAAGISQPGFYVHFDSIADLLKEIIDIHYKTVDEPNAKAMLQLAEQSDLQVEKVLEDMITAHFNNAVQYPSINVYSSARNALHKSDLLDLVAAQFEKSKDVFCEAFRLILKREGVQVNRELILMHVDLLFSSHDTLVIGCIEGRYTNKKRAADFLVSNTLSNLDYLINNGKAIKERKQCGG